MGVSRDSTESGHITEQHRERIESSCLSRHSHHFPQISREDSKEEWVRERKEKREELKIGNAVNHVNEGLFTEGPEEVVVDES